MPISQELADWINEFYKVNVLNISFDYTISPDNTPRLGVIVETFEECKLFREGPNGIGSYKEDCQIAIREKFCVLLEKYKSINKTLIDELFAKMNLNWTKVNNRVVFIYFAHFSTIAKSESRQNIPRDEIAIFINKYKSDCVWDIHCHTSIINVFFYTNKQKNKNIGNPIFDEMCKEYYKMIKQYDEFGYFESNSILVSFDSKENLDNNYNGSFFNYYR